MQNQRHRFFLEAIDPDHGCPVLEAAFYVDDVSELHRLIDTNGVDDGGLDYSDVMAPELLAIQNRYGVVFEPGDRRVRIARWHSIRAAPYLIHTNYELMLLLEGRKKFALFGDGYPPAQHYNESYFDRFVVAGQLHKETALEPFSKPVKTRTGHVFEGVREVYYTPKGEEWRIQAWKLIAKASRKAGWNESFERLQGMLFGYQEWEMDWWIAQYKKPPPIQTPACSPSADEAGEG